MNFPNFISLARLLSVPVTIWLILEEAWREAFVLFALAGMSDALDGFIAKHFNLKSDLGQILDPLADKALLMAIYIALGFKGVLPIWLALLVVSRDILLIGGTILSWMLEIALDIVPSRISKINTALQIALAGLILANLSLIAVPEIVRDVFTWMVAATTLLSGAGYVLDFARAQNSQTPGSGQV